MKKLCDLYTCADCLAQSNCSSVTLQCRCYVVTGTNGGSNVFEQLDTSDDLVCLAQSSSTQRVNYKSSVGKQQMC